jgi:iron complex outermembrane receptor protein
MAVLAALALAVPAVPAVAAEARRPYDIPAQRLDQALLLLAVNSGRQITFAPSTIQGMTSRPLKGEHTFTAALRRLLPERGLRWESSDGLVLILPAAPARPAPPRRDPPRRPAPAPRPPPVPQIAPPPPRPVEALEITAVTGTRGRARTVRDSPVPIDVIHEPELEASGFVDTNNVLMTLLPSYAVARNSNSDSGTFVRPATLRGLSGDKALLLVNSKRRHRSAAIGPAAGAGSQAADSATIPSSAIKTIEVLRDGAGALYGSDAIAGVINFLLRDDAEGGSLSVRYGEYYQGDGRDVLVAGNLGAPLTETGFVNASFEYSRQGRTNRGRQFCNPTFCVETYAAQNPVYAALVGDQPVQRHGQPESEAVRGFVNSGLELVDGSALYAFGNYSLSRTSADATYRYPVANQAVNDVPIRLEDGRAFRFNELFPAGFTPRYSAVIADYSLVGGYKGQVGQALSYDLSARYGRNRMRYEIENTVNPSLGPGSPRAFMRAIYTATDFALNADLRYEADVPALDSPLAAAFGGEYRREGFRMAPGEPLAYAAGPYSRADPFDFCTDETNLAARTLRPSAPRNAGIACDLASDPVYNTQAALTLTVSPQTADALGRDSYAAYAEVSSDVTRKLFVDVAARYERFSDFGSTFDGKFSSRLALTPRFNLRGSVGTGFRAPTPGQQTFSNFQINTVDGVILQSGLFPVKHPVAVFLGARPLKPEKAVNLSGGATASLFGSLNLSVDLYRIGIRDQYYAVSPIAVTPAIRAVMLQANVAGAAQIMRVNFFQNAFDSRVTGLDVVGTNRFMWRDGQSTSLTVSFNHNTYRIRRIAIADLFDAEEIFDFENGAPRWKAIVSAVHDVGPFKATLRSTLWGPYRNMLSVAEPIVQTFKPVVYLDLEVSYQVNDTFRLTLGARNILDKYPAKDATGETTGAGQIYRADSYLDWQGGFYFAKIEAAF